MMKNMVLFEPAIIDLDVPESADVDLDQDSSCLLELELRVRDYTRVRRMPVGYLAYTRRYATRPFRKRWVDPNSIRTSRIKPLSRFASSLIDKRMKLSPSAVYERFSRFSGFLEFCDSNDLQDVLDGPSNYHSALIKYSFKLDKGVSETGKGNGANRILTVVGSIASDIFPGADYNFAVGVKFPGYSKDEQNHTRVPDEEKLFPIYRVADAVFKEVLGFLCGNDKQPKVVERYGESYWFLPTYYPLITETAIFENQRKKSRGVILTVIRAHALKLSQESAGTISPSEAIKIVMQRLLSGGALINEGVSSRAKFERLSVKFRQEHIHRLAMLAHDCFLFIFILNTSANVSVAANIRWSEALEIEAEVQRLRSIKRRAQNKSVGVIFGVRFLNRLRDYFKLRAYLPGVNGFKYLFGTFDLKKEPLQVGDNPSAALVQKLRRLVNPRLDAIGYKELRVYHHNSKTNHDGLAVAAHSAQHTETTAINSYTSGNEDVVISEGVMYFSGLGHAVSEHHSTQAGGCVGNLIEAVQIDVDEGFTADCKNLIGCLFCKHYILHMNLKDAEKLISMEYLITQLESIQSDPSEFHQTYGPTLARISWLLKTIGSFSEFLQVQVPLMRQKIFQNESLTAYWQAKLNILDELGVI